MDLTEAAIRLVFPQHQGNMIFVISKNFSLSTTKQTLITDQPVAVAVQETAGIRSAWCSGSRSTARA